MTLDGHHYVLSTGRKIYAHGGQLSVLPASRALYFGHDGIVEHEELTDDDDRLTPAEREEIADFMIRTWQEWKALDQA